MMASPPKETFTYLYGQFASQSKAALFEKTRDEEHTPQHKTWILASYHFND